MKLFVVCQVIVLYKMTVVNRNQSVNKFVNNSRLRLDNRKTKLRTRVEVVQTLSLDRSCIYFKGTVRTSMISLKFGTLELILGILFYRNKY